MGLTKYKLGELIEQRDERNSDSNLGLDAVRGISIEKKFIDTKAKMQDVSLAPYKLVKPGDFSYVTVTSRNGEKITIAHNRTNQVYLNSSSYIVFYIADETKLLSDFLFIYFNRPEFDRYSRFNSWGSARETFSWEDMCDIEIELPPIEIQQKYVAIYNAMVANQKCYEESLEDLKLACDAELEELLHNEARERLEPYIKRHDERNKDNSIKNVKGVSTSKEFRDPTSKVDVNKLQNYKIVHPRQISFVQTTNNEKVLSSALNLTDEDIVVTSVNEVFSTDETKLLPEYLELFLLRDEFDRYARFHSWGSARETFTWIDMQDVRIPIPELKVQRSIADMYTAYNQRKEINKRMKAQIKDICPILIKGSLEEASAA